MLYKENTLWKQIGTLDLDPAELTAYSQLESIGESQFSVKSQIHRNNNYSYVRIRYLHSAHHTYLVFRSTCYRKSRNDLEITLDLHHQSSRQPSRSIE